ncbi:MAG: YkvA family protein [Scytonema sp. PMC 1069.18]|nr:YkvA family protein [Scytonema sp. PMC 1069.18]MEC4886859.1 YkvA family protein [Scytonema sp. PMC 1070.18]
MRKRFFTQVFLNGIRKVLRHPKYRWFAIVAGLFYLVSPLDISPDVFPVVGWIDDGLIASLVVAEASQIVMEQLKNRKKVTKADLDSLQTATTVDVKAVSL